MDPPAARAFANHAIVKYDGNWYDPSYGAGPYDAEWKHEDAAISGLLDSGVPDRAKKATAGSSNQELQYNRRSDLE